ncbi:DNA-deoxyinosine glycosylase [Ruminococcaceae bacterium OttesenSCG-928-A16]|nr:DNA-deoxyinosine glycosylase [Ruminococcaceae bacterium OttesenSCG-928-A16]
MQVRGSEMGFSPIFAPHARALILGSYPSPKSFENQFYYGHPQNRFWPLLAALASAPVPQTIPQKKALLLQNNLALWDALQQCSIVGAADVSITNPVPNDIATLVKQSNIQAIFCNGAAAYKFYHRYCEADTGLQATALPSTSPANAAYTMPRLIQAWQPLRQYMGTP